MPETISRLIHWRILVARRLESSSGGEAEELVARIPPGPMRDRIEAATRSGIKGPGIRFMHHVDSATGKRKEYSTREAAVRDEELLNATKPADVLGYLLVNVAVIEEADEPLLPLLDRWRQIGD